MKSQLPFLLKFCSVLIIFFAFGNLTYAQTIKGSVTDAKTGETLIGATVHIENGDLHYNTTVKLDGVYTFKNVPSGTYKLKVTSVGYVATKSYNVESTQSGTAILNVAMVSNATALTEVTVTEHVNRESEASARNDEKNAATTLNAVSAQAIAISPDVLVSNVVSRVSGISIDRSTTGDAEHVIIRGMDKQYNTTLVNGIKIPSPDNKNRYVPLDIFPAGLVERLEVYKTLTPDMEGDASGGVVNMVMKSAPDRLVVDAEAGTGYSQLFFNRSFETFDHSAVNSQSPGQIHPGQPASISEFPYQNLITTKGNAPINKTASLTIGNRFFDKKLGIIFAGTYQNLYQGDNSFIVVQENTVGASPNINTPNQETAFQSADNRQYSSELNRLGATASIDYRFNSDNIIKLFGTYVQLNEYRVRETQEDTYGGYSYHGYRGTFSIDDRTQTRTDLQNIYNVTLSGKHNNLFNGFSLDWTATTSQATHKLPDMAEFDTNYNTAPVIPAGSPNQPTGNPSEPYASVATSVQNTPVMVGNESREWMNNTDKDLAGYLNLHYKTANIFDRKAEFSIGGMYRHKTRDNFLDAYTLSNTFISGTANPELYTSIPSSTFYFANTQDPYGTYATDAGDYTFTEDIGAIYGMIKYNVSSKLDVILGVREENTNQSFDTNQPASFAGKSGSINYMDILPSVNIKYTLTDEQALRAAYYKSVLRPSFYDLVPATDNSQDDAFYQHIGNPYLLHTAIDNYDLRYEFFPGVFDEFMVGGFYKHIMDPIETSLQQGPGGATLYFIPNNPSASAQNFGAEAVATKYFGNIGLSVNYTYTNSQITTAKSINVQGEISTRNQTRPLQGQAANIANASILYKDQKLGLDAQLSIGYTGERIAAVSNYYGLDTWEKPSTYLDFSAQKKIGKHFIIFGKANNLLNTPYELFIKQDNTGNYAGLLKYPHQESPKYTTVEYSQFYARYSLGVKYKF
jgi:TonB-dependent receptor